MLKFLYKNIYSLWINRVKPIKAFKAIRALDKNKEDTTQVFHVIDALKGASDKKYFKIFSNSIVGKKILDRKIVQDTENRSLMVLSNQMPNMSCFFTTTNVAGNHPQQMSFDNLTSKY